MKFIHLSDPHIVLRPQKVRGVDVCSRLDAAVQNIRENFADAEFCMVTGDLVHNADLDTYREVKSILDRLPMPWHALMGNHDVGMVAAKIFPDFHWQPNGVLQYHFETSVGRFIALDSSLGGKIDSGAVDSDRLNFLHDQLSAAHDCGDDVFLFMHHVPFNVGIEWLDGIKMENGDELWSVLSEFKNIRHMFFGHIHRPTHGSWHGIPFSTVRSTAHQFELRLSDSGEAFVGESPSFAIVLVDEENVVIHDHNYLEVS